MKDTVISGRRKRIEVITFLVCFLLANLANVYAIMTYDRSSFSELFTSIGYVAVFSVVLYIAWCGIRLIFCLGRELFRSKKGVS